MYEHTLRRLARLEAWCGLRQKSEGRVNRVWFDGIEEQTTYCTGPSNFILHRDPDEDLADFEIRACREALALMPPRGAHPPPILIFMS